MRISPPVTGKIWLLIRTRASDPSRTRSPRVGMRFTLSRLRFRRRRHENVQLEFIRRGRHTEENYLHASQQVRLNANTPGVTADVVSGADGNRRPGIVLAPRAIGNGLPRRGAGQGNAVAGEVAQVV